MEGECRVTASNTVVIAVPVELMDVWAKLDRSAGVSPPSLVEPAQRA